MATDKGKTKSIIGEVLRVNCILLEDKLSDPCSLARHLLSTRLITSDEVELVEAAGSGTRHEKTRKLVDFLRIKDDFVLDRVLEYLLLKDGTQLHIFRKLKEYAEKLGYKWQLQLVEEAKISANQVLPEKWWPENKTLPNSFLPRTDTVKVGQLLIETVHQQLHSTEGRTIAIVAQTQSLVGMGGVGKTTTAKWYGNKYESHYDHVLWIDAEGTLLETSCTSLAKDLSIPVKDSDNDKKSMKKLMREVNTKLRDCKCVYIFDNVERYTDVRELISTNSLHYTIITSRMLGDWGNATEQGRIPTCQVNVFKEEESFQFLKQALLLAAEMDDDKLPSDEELRELGELLGYLPLALQCAVTVIINPVLAWTFTSYLKQIKSDLKILTDKEILDEYTRPLSAALTLSLDHIGRGSAEDSSKHCELCRRIMDVTVYCIPERIDEEMFTHLQDVTAMQVGNAVDDLIKFSLLTVNAGIKSERGRRKLNVHRLLQHVLKTSVEADPKHESKVLRLVLMCFQSDYEKHKYAAIPVWKKVLEKHENVLEEFPQFGVHLARVSCETRVGIELIEVSLSTLMRIYGAVGLPIFQYNLELAYLFMNRRAYDRADSTLKELKEKVTSAEAIFREDILLHIRMASLTLMCTSDRHSIWEMKLYIMNEYSDLLEKAGSSKLNDAVSGYTIRHWFFRRSLKWLYDFDVFYSSRAQLAVVCNYATVLLNIGKFALAVDMICAHLDSLNCPTSDIVRMEDFRRFMNVVDDTIKLFPYQDLFKFYTWLKSRELISHWMQTNLDKQHDNHVEEVINTYLQSLFTENEKDVLHCEMEYLFQLTGHPK